MSNSKEYNLKLGELATCLRNYSKFQKEIWQKIPFLALLATKGDEEKYKHCYENGYWYLNSSPMDKDVPHVVVDCENGELIYLRRLQVPDSKYIALINFDDLDASKVQEQLEEELILSKYPSMWEEHELKNWIKTKVELYKLNPNSYRRVHNTHQERNLMISNMLDDKIQEMK